MTGNEQIERRSAALLWSTDDCIDVTLIWLRQKRDLIDDAIMKIKAVQRQHPQQTPGA